MIDALLVSNVVLWILVIALAAVVAALVRQIGLLHERIAPAGALSPATGPRPGTAAPIVEVSDWQHRPLSIGGIGQPDTLLFFVSPTCPVCKILLPIVERVCRAEDPDLRLVIASDGPRAEHEDFVRTHGLDARTYVLSTALGLAYRVERLPHAALIDTDGTLRAQGLVNSREHLESLFEARGRGVASVQEYLSDAGRRRGRREMA